jgi:hypothetical protein
MLRLGLQASIDGLHWRQIALDRELSGSPIALPATARARFIRLVLPKGGEIFEWSFSE